MLDLHECIRSSLFLVYIFCYYTCEPEVIFKDLSYHCFRKNGAWYLGHASYFCCKEANCGKLTLVIFSKLMVYVHDVPIVSPQWLVFINLFQKWLADNDTQELAGYLNWNYMWHKGSWFWNGWVKERNIYGIYLSKTFFQDSQFSDYKSNEFSEFSQKCYYLEVLGTCPNFIPLLFKRSLIF